LKGNSTNSKKTQRNNPIIYQRRGREIEVILKNQMEILELKST
jgi:hypothetical protein